MPSNPPLLRASDYVHGGDPQGLSERLDDAGPGPEWDHAAVQMLWRWSQCRYWVVKNEELWDRVCKHLSPHGAARALVTAARLQRSHAVQTLLATVPATTPGWGEARRQAARQLFLGRQPTRTSSYSVHLDLLQALSAADPSWKPTDFEAVWPAAVQGRHAPALAWLWSRLPPETTPRRLSESLRRRLLEEGPTIEVQELAEQLLDANGWTRKMADLSMNLRGAPVALRMAVARQVGVVATLRAASCKKQWSFMEALAEHLSPQDAPRLSWLSPAHPQLPRLNALRAVWTLDSSVPSAASPGARGPRL